MRWVLLCLALAGCGADSSGGGSSTTPAPVIASNTIVVGTCSLGGCRAAAAITVDKELDTHAVFYTWSLGAVPPACTADNSVAVTDGIFSFPIIGYSMTFSGRACIRDMEQDTFDEGIAASAATPNR